MNVPNHSDLANTDVQYAAATSSPTPLIFYSVGGQLVWDQKEGQPNLPISRDKYLEWFGYVLREGNIPQIISISEGDVELALPPEYAAICASYFQSLVRRVSVSSS